MKFFAVRITSFLYGLTLPLRALRLILAKRTLLFWSALPVMLTLALSIWGAAWLKAKLAAAGMQWLTGFGLAPDSITVQAAMIFLQIVLFVLAAISFSLLAGVVASPFNDFLAEAAEPHCEPLLPELLPEQQSFRWKIRAVRIDIVKTVFITALQLILVIIGLLAFWIPGLNLIPFLLAFWLLTLQFTGYPQTRRGDGLGTSFRFLFRHAFACLGFGLAVGTLFAVPFLSAIALPLAVVGGTLLYARARIGDLK